MRKQFRTNIHDKNLYCTYSKEKIFLGELYCLVFEKYINEVIEKPYKLEYLECLDDEE